MRRTGLTKSEEVTKCPKCGGENVSVHSTPNGVFTTIYCQDCESMTVQGRLFFSPQTLQILMPQQHNRYIQRGLAEKVSRE